MTAPTRAESMLDLAGIGWPVFPVHHVTADGRCSCGNRGECATEPSKRGKHPRTQHGLKDATTSEESIGGWNFDHPDANVGVRTGARPDGAGIVVIDIDPRHGGDKTLAALEAQHGPLPDTVTSSTGGGGRHYIFAYPNGVKITNSGGRVGPGIDVRGEGGYIIVPPSNHYSGGIYAWLDGCSPHERKPAEAPDWLIDLMMKPKASAPVERMNGHAGHGLLIERARAYAAKVQPVSEGNRDNAAFQLAGHLFSFVDESTGETVSVDDVHSIVGDWNLRCSPPLPDLQLRRAVLSAQTNGTPRTPKSVTSSSRRNRAPGEAVEDDTEIMDLNLIRASEVESSRVDWLWHRRLPLGKYAVLAGIQGQGKSLLAVDIAARVSAGRPFHDTPSIPNPAGDVVIFAAEDDLSDTVRPRLEAAGADLNRVHLDRGVGTIGKDGTRCFNLLSDVPILRRRLESLPDTRLVILDPIGSYIGNRTDANRETEVREALHPIIRLAAERRFTLLAVAHLSKAPNPNAVLRVLGSVAFTAMARAVWLVIPNPELAGMNDEARWMLRGKWNLGRCAPGAAFEITESSIPDAGCIRWDAGEVTTTADQAFAAADSGGRRSTAGDEAETFLLDVLAGGPMTAAEVYALAKEAGVSERTLKRAKKALDIITTAQRGEGRKVVGWEWSLPDGSQP